MCKHEYIESELNKDYVITYPNLHDSNLTKIELLPNKKVKILFITKSNSYEIICNDIKYLNCSSFKEGNIVFDVVAWHNEKYPIKGLREILQIQSEEKSLYLDNVAKDIESGKLILFMVNPSYGCELVCLCGSYKISSIGNISNE